MAGGGGCGGGGGGGLIYSHDNHDNDDDAAQFDPLLQLIQTSRMWTKERARTHESRTHQAAVVSESRASTCGYESRPPPPMSPPAVASTQRRNNARSADHPFPIPPPPSPHPQIAPPSVPSLSAAAGNRIEICIVSSAAAGKQIRIESFPCCGDRGTIATSQEAPRDSMMLGGVGLQQQESSCASRRNAA
ncbi:unnamed protein product [Closterium sp. NIES-54]